MQTVTSGGYFVQFHTSNIKQSVNMLSYRRKPMKTTTLKKNISSIINSLDRKTLQRWVSIYTASNTRIYNTIKTRRLSVTEVGVAGWAWSLQGKQT